jgi:chromosome segregation ATPase
VVTLEVNHIDEKLCQSRQDAIKKKIETLYARLEEREKILNLQIDNLNQNVKTAKSVLDHRLEGMNDIRNQLTVQTATFEERINYLNSDIQSIQKVISKREGSSTWTDALWVVLLGGASAVVVSFIVSFFINKGT